MNLISVAAGGCAGALVYASTTNPVVAGAIGGGVAVLGFAVSSLLPSDAPLSQESDESLRRKRREEKRAQKAQKVAEAKEQFEQRREAATEAEEVSESKQAEPVTKKKKKQTDTKQPEKPAATEQKKQQKSQPAVSSEKKQDKQDSKKKKEQKPEKSSGAPAKAATAPEQSKPAQNNNNSNGSGKPEQQQATKSKKEKKQAAATADGTNQANQAQTAADQDAGWTLASHQKGAARNKAASKTAPVKQAQKPAQGKQQQPAADGVEEVKTTSVQLKIDATHYGKIIGSGGETLKLLEQKSGTKINIPRRDSGKDASIVITGPAEGVQEAQKAINDLVTKGFSSITNPGTTSGELRIEAKLHGIIIGEGGAHIRAIQGKTGTKINMPEKKGAANDADKITISGSKDGIKAAKAAIRDLINEGFSTLTHEGWSKKEIAVPRDQLKYVIGQKGQTIKSIQGNTRCKITIPKPDAENQNVIVAGPADALASAEKQILRALEVPVAQETEEDAEVLEGWSSVEEAEW
jgi:rRNA processing protein Krr1/Pno1